jgi:hypothetical protein
VGFVGCPVIPLFSLRGKKEKKKKEKKKKRRWTLRGGGFCNQN